MVDARCNAVGSEERPFLGSFQKGGGARNRAERRAEPRSIKGGHARSLLSSVHARSLVHALLLFSFSSSLLGLCSLLSSRWLAGLSPIGCCSPPLFMVHALFLARAPFLLARSRARGPARPVGGDADGRRRSVACGGPACPDEGCRRGFAGRVGSRNQA